MHAEVGSAASACTLESTETQDAELPLELIPRILQHIELRQRLGSLSLVSRAWHAAAVTATLDISISINPTRAPDVMKLLELESWLELYGSKLKTLTIVSHSSSLSRPNTGVAVEQLQQLQSLHLDHVVLLSAVRLSTLTLLTALELITTSMHADNWLVALGGLTQLRRLYLSDSACYVYDSDHHSSLSRAIGSMTMLTSLWVSGHFYSDDHLAMVGQLQQLQKLTVEGIVINPQPATAWNNLPASLTNLELINLRQCQSFTISSSNMPGFVQLTKLQRLVITCGEYAEFQFDPNFLEPDPYLIEPDILAQLTQLTHLTWSSRYELLDGSDVGQFLVALGSLTLLQHLHLHDTILNPDPSLQEYAALFSSSHLTHLDLQGCSMSDGFLQHMIPVEKQLSALKVLRLGTRCASDEYRLGLQHIMSSCPALEELVLPCPMPEAAQLSSITKLTALTQLVVAVKGATYRRFDLGFIPLLGQLFGLRQLHLSCSDTHCCGDDEFGCVDDSDSTADAGHLMPLSQLTRLTRLKVESIVGLPDVAFETKGQQPDVWQQLQQYCDDAHVRP